MTSLGRQALAGGEFSRAAHERRRFSFLQSDHPGHPPRFVSLKTLLFRPAGEGWKFNVSDLEACFRQTPEWKELHGFPLDVEEPGEASEWQRVIVDDPEFLLAALVVALRRMGLTGWPALQSVKKAGPCKALNPLLN